MNNTEMQDDDHLEGRMPYNAPELRVHGEIAQLTQAASNTGKRDNLVSGQINKS